MLTNNYFTGTDTQLRTLRPVEHHSSHLEPYVTPTIPPKRVRRYIIGGHSGSFCTEDKEERLVLTPHNLEALDRMEAHRRFHAAESGQLLPRKHRKTKSSGSGSSSQFSALTENKHFNNQRSVSWPVAKKEVIVNMTVPHGKPQRRVSPAAIPYSASVEQHPPPKSCPSAWTDRTSELMNEKLGTNSRSTTYIITGSPRSHSVSVSSATTMSEPSLRSRNPTVLPTAS